MQSARRKKRMELAETHLGLLLKRDFSMGLGVYIIDRKFIFTAMSAEPLVNVNMGGDISKKAIANLHDGEIDKLVRIFTLFDRYILCRGSVAAVPYLIKLLFEREFVYIESLVNWVIGINESKNHYLPFGEIRFYKKSYTDYVRNFRDASNKFII